MLTEWQPYRRPDLDRVKQMLKEAVVFDGRNLWDVDGMRRAGFSYHSVGRVAAEPIVLVQSAAAGAD